jgi:4-alpha-glucanotransferase
MTTPCPSALAELAVALGVQVTWTGADGHPHSPDVDVIVATLEAMGTPARTEGDAVNALAEVRLARARRGLEPVSVHRAASWQPVSVTLPARADPEATWLTLRDEGGESRTCTLAAATIGPPEALSVSNEHFETYQVDPELAGLAALPPGSYDLRLETPGLEAHSYLLVPPHAPRAARTWGLFMPLHALRSETDWGIGSYSDLAELGRWTGALGGSMVGCLPLYPISSDPPIDPSPYLPVSRLAYSDLYIDPLAVPELAGCPEAMGRLADPQFRYRMAQAHQAAEVDYDEVAALRSQVLEPLARTVQAGRSPRRQQLAQFASEFPDLVAYARFRAERDHRLGVPGDPEVRADYHLLLQWLASEQLAEATSVCPLYADLPVGVAADGFDPDHFANDFVTGVHGGAPPDRFFSSGQDWSFPPLHPERMRLDGYRYLTQVLRRACRHASVLRIDHVMGLQRLYWVPAGADATHGTYVQYRAEELFALACLEANRAGTVLVGEDLGTVPEGLRERMHGDGMLRSWVFQFESTAVQPLPQPPEECLASLGTHDLPRFGAYLDGQDIADNERAGRLSASEAHSQTAERQSWGGALRAATDPSMSSDSSTTEVLSRALTYLAESPAALVLIDLEETWGERLPQNRPGTGTEARNWRRRGALTLEVARDDQELRTLLRQVDQGRSSPQVLALNREAV